MGTIHNANILLNLDISSLTSKIKLYVQQYDAINCDTVKALIDLVSEVDDLVVKKKLLPHQALGETERIIIDNYDLTRSFNCKHCSKPVKMTQSALLEHLTKQHKKLVVCKADEKIAKNQSTSKGTSHADKKPKKEKKMMSKPAKTFIERHLPSSYVELMLPIHRKIMNDNEAMDNMICELREIFEDEVEDLSIIPFGSRSLGLGTEGSDLDLYLDWMNNYNGAWFAAPTHNRKTIECVTRAITDALHLSTNYKKIRALVNARTPVVEAFHKKAKINCDFTFSSGLGHCNNVLLKYFFDIQPVCYHVCIYIKKWAKQLSINDLNSYAVNLMVIFYFQQNKFLPPVYQLEVVEKSDLVEARWQTHFERYGLEHFNIPL
ncbi:terminal uridylyltransferase Tailor, partial [Uranotaenia lowii]|uniref:terminal uridylyltransferase Tailor n=1 Tax=Uranotaenia lowii TaxID=190385 RepID=UPI00247A34BE